MKVFLLTGVAIITHIPGLNLFQDEIWFWVMDFILKNVENITFREQKFTANANHLLEAS